MYEHKQYNDIIDGMLYFPQSVYMAHALKRISYATCNPEQRQFSFLAREPKSQSAHQYCHAFTTQTEEEVSTLTSSVVESSTVNYLDP